MKKPMQLLAISRRNLGILVLFLVGISVFGPKGLFRLLVMKQETLRLETDTVEMSAQIAKLAREISDFKQSSWSIDRAIRSELGLLMENEWSVEFPVEKNAP